MMLPRIIEIDLEREEFLLQSAKVLREYLHKKGFMPYPPNLKFCWNLTGHNIIIKGADIAESINLVGRQKKT